MYTALAPQGERLFQGYELVTSKSKGCLFTVAPRLTITLKNQLRKKMDLNPLNFFSHVSPHAMR